MPRLLGLLLVATLALAATGCGDKLEVRTEGKTEGLYLDIGGLKYQIQISRILNPSDREDAGYLKGLPVGSRPGPGEAWFGVFLRVENAADSGAHPAARRFEIVDTQDDVFRPTPVDTRLNVFAYRPGILPPHQLIPDAGELATYGPTAGAMVLFRLRNSTFQNRPLVFRIFSPTNAKEVGTVDLDV